MATYKVVDADQLDSDLSKVAVAIRGAGRTTQKLSFPQEMVSAIGSLTKVTKMGQVNCGYVADTLNLTSYSNYKNITVSNIYLVPVSFTVTATGEITGGTYNIIKSYSNGILTARRDSIPGSVGVQFLMDVYIIE